MRVLPRLPALKKGKEGKRGQEVDRGKYRIAGLLMFRLWPETQLRLGLMMTPYLLARVMIPLLLEVEVVAEEVGEEEEVVGDPLLLSEEASMGMRRYFNLPLVRRREVLVLHLRIRIENRRQEQRYTRYNVMYNTGNWLVVDLHLRTDLFLTDISTHALPSFFSLFLFLSPFFIYIILTYTILCSLTDTRLHTTCLRCPHAIAVRLAELLLPLSQLCLIETNPLSLPFTVLEPCLLLSLVVHHPDYKLPTKHKYKARYHGENHLNRKDPRIDLIIDIPLLLPNQPNFSLLSRDPSDKCLDHLLVSVD